MQFGTTKPKDCEAAEGALGVSTEDRVKLVTSPEPRKRKPASAKSPTATFESPSVALKMKNKLLDFSCVDGGMPCSSQNAEARNFTHQFIYF